MRVDEFDYELPEELIAQTPISQRDKSRLLVVNRKDRSLVHKLFNQVHEYINPGDILVVNDTKVIPARLFGRRQTGGQVEILLLTDLGEDLWECLVRPGRKVRIGDEIKVGRDREDYMVGTVVARTEYGGRVIRWDYQGIWEENLKKFGKVPLPPYIKNPLTDPRRYQTVYAKTPGSSAAPTAGLHFTPELLQKIREKGVFVESITLNIGLGTFRPVSEEIVEKHKMHHEYYVITERAASAINGVKRSGGRVFAVGTTVVRALESSAAGNRVRPFSGTTHLFIYPGYRFKIVDCLITNFHLPKSTLLMLVSAFAGKTLIMQAYRKAIKERYRFYSFGDAMLIL